MGTPVPPISWAAYDAACFERYGPPDETFVSTSARALVLCHGQLICPVVANRTAQPWPPDLPRGGHTPALVQQQAHHLGGQYGSPALLTRNRPDVFCMRFFPAGEMGLDHAEVAEIGADGVTRSADTWPVRFPVLTTTPATSSRPPSRTEMGTIGHLRRELAM